MTPKTGLVPALVSAIVAALVSAAILLVVWRTGAVNRVVHDYLTKHPEILVDMTTELDRRQQAETSAKQQKVIGENAELIFRSPLSYAAGNSSGDVTVVEFFDYNCGYCRRALPQLVKLIDADDKVRVVFKEFPIFGEESEWAAKAALAAGKQGKYFEMHQKMYAAPGKADKDKALRVAAEIGLDVPQLEKDMADPSTAKALAETKELAQKLGIEGTPFYMIGDRVIAGAPDDLYDQLVAKVGEVREKGCTATC